MKLVSCILAAAAALLTSAAAIGADFPDGSVPLAPAALSAALAEKVFSVKPAQGPTWRWQFNAGGHFFINVGNLADDGSWSAKDSSLCTQGKKIKASCNEVRELGPDLYLKRDSGEVVKLVAQ